MSRSTSGSLLSLGPPLAQARGAVILIHGRGSSARDIAHLADTLNAPEVAFLAPSAEGGTWYPQRFFAPPAQNEPFLTSALATIEALVRQAAAARIGAGRIGLVGFSQGACLALEHAARAGRRYGFVAALSGALIGPLDTSRETVDLQGAPVLLGCAEADAHIPLEYVERSAQVLEGLGAAVTKQIYPGAAHSVFQPEVDWIDARVAAMLAG